VKSVALGTALTASLHIPILGVLMVLAAFPVLIIFPEFAAAGPDVGYSFAMLYLKSAKSWLAFTCYFTLVALGIGMILGRKGDEA